MSEEAEQPTSSASFNGTNSASYSAAPLAAKVPPSAQAHSFVISNTAYTSTILPNFISIMTPRKPPERKNFVTKPQFASIVGVMREAEAKAAAATAENQAATESQTREPPALPMPFNNGKDSPSGPLFNAGSERLRLDNEGLRALHLQLQKDEQEAELAKACEARDQEDSDVFDEVGVKFLGFRKVLLAKVPRIIPALRRKSQVAKVLSVQTWLEELQETVAVISSYELFTSGRAFLPQLTAVESMAAIHNVSVGQLYLPARTRVHLSFQGRQKVLRDKADQVLAGRKADEERKHAAHRWAAMSETLTQTAEKHKSMKRTTWFVKTLEELQFSPLEETIAEENEEDAH